MIEFTRRQREKAVGFRLPDTNPVHIGNTIERHTANIRQSECVYKNGYNNCLVAIAVIIGFILDFVWDYAV